MDNCRSVYKSVRRASVVVVCGATVGCQFGDAMPLGVVEPPTTVTASPSNVSVAVGDSARVVGGINSSATLPPTFLLCTVGLSSIATAKLSGAGCTVVGVSPGITVVTLTTTSGHSASASVTVVAK